jgi:hypothetical protein
MGVRRGGRIEQEIPIIVIGSDTEGKVFLEHTSTILLSRHGAGIISQYKLSPEQEMLVRLQDTNNEAEVRVVGQIGTQSGRYVYGLAFLDSNIDFWGLEFPPSTESEREASRSVLECSRCKSREVIEHSDLELDVYVFNDNIVRYCKKCRSSTVWKASSAQANEPSVSSASEQRHDSYQPATPVVLPATPILPDSPENKRKHGRTRVTYAACIRRPAFDDDVVVCEDMSRGGVRFKSRKLYFAGTMIEIAVP